MSRPRKRNPSVRVSTLRLPLLAVLLVTVGGVWQSIDPPSVEAAMFTVNSTLDTGDAVINGTCDDGGGNCTLRAAIQEANVDAIVDTINFNIGGGGDQTINSTTGFAVTKPVVIDGTSQPSCSAPCIELDGNVTAAYGIDVTGGGATIRGLAINRYAHGIVLQTLGGNTVVGNYLGVGLDGVTDKGNTSFGVFVLSANNIVGGSSAADRNIISGNGSGVGLSSATSDNNEIIGNYIGTDASGTVDVGNSNDGVQLASAGDGNVIGKPGAGNVISGNQNTGFFANSGTSTISANYIGTTADGMSALPNGPGGSGVRFEGGSHVVGGITAAHRNVIAGNGEIGIFLGADGNTILGNYIGLAADGATDLGSQLYGIRITNGAANNLIGGVHAYDRNVISGNNTAGISADFSGNTNNRIEGNYIGTDATGTLDRGNLTGIEIATSTSSFTVGSVIPSGGNVISGNDSVGIAILGGGSDAHSILSNFIGTAADGVTALPNASHGINIAHHNITVGGTPSGGNVIAHNTGSGVRVFLHGDFNEIRGNSIHDNGGPGINMDSGGGSTPNNLIAPPTVDGPTFGTDGAGSCVGCTIDIFSDDSTEGRVYHGSTTVDGSGNWSFVGGIAGPNLTATMTDASGNTSAFSPIYTLTIFRLGGSAGNPGFAGDGLQIDDAAVRLDSPEGMYESPDGNLLFADTSNNRIRKVEPNETNGMLNTDAGGGAGTCMGNETNSIGDGCLANEAILNKPTDVIKETSTGHKYIADRDHCRVRKVDGGTGIITTIAGTGTCGYDGDGALATTKQLNKPTGVAVDFSGNVIIADMDNCRVRKVDVTTGVISTLAGTGTCGYDGEGKAYSKQLNKPKDVAVAAGNFLYIADKDNNRVRKINLTTDDIWTIAGTGAAGDSGDNGPGTLAQLNKPEAVATDEHGNVFIADTENNRIKHVSKDTGIIKNVVGTGAQGSTGDGGPPANATLNKPKGIAVGSLTISDTGNHTMRGAEGEIDPSTGGSAGSARPSTSCSNVPRAVGTTDLALALAPLGLVLGRRRLGRLFALIAVTMGVRLRAAPRV